MAALLTTMPSPVESLFANEKDTFQHEEYDDFSDDSDMTDDSSDSPSVDSKVVSSPCSVGDVASTAASSWPTRPVRRKRTRMSPDERKVRHREVQRQFMKRKRARIAELRKIQAGVEQQLRLASVYYEIEQLKSENDSLAERLEICETVGVQPAMMEFGDLVFSVPSEDEFMITACEWSEIFDVLSDEADADSDSGSLY